MLSVISVFSLCFPRLSSSGFLCRLCVDRHYTWPKGHAATNFTKWRTTSEPYKVRHHSSTVSQRLQVAQLWQRDRATHALLQFAKLLKSRF